MKCNMKGNFTTPHNPAYGTQLRYSQLWNYYIFNISKVLFCDKIYYFRVYVSHKIREFIIE